MRFYLKVFNEATNFIIELKATLCNNMVIYFGLHLLHSCVQVESV
jgi:hypothetical protein